jgi:hypothetical protein
MTLLAPIRVGEANYSGKLPLLVAKQDLDRTAERSTHS